MSDHGKPLIENLVEAIKGYFSVTGLMLLGVYMVKNASDAPFGVTFINYVGGISAVFSGAIIGLWYSVYMIQKILTGTKNGSIRRIETIICGLIVVLASLIVLSIIYGSVVMSCGIK